MQLFPLKNIGNGLNFTVAGENVFCPTTASYIEYLLLFFKPDFGPFNRSKQSKSPE